MTASIDLLDNLGQVCVPSQSLSDNQRDEADDGNWRNPMCRIDGPFRHHNKYRVLVVDRETKKTTRYTYETEAEAKAAIPKLARSYARVPGHPMPEALAAYEVHLATRGNTRKGPNKPRTIATTMQRLRAVFATDVITGDLDTVIMAKCWDAWAKGKAVDTVLNTLAQVRTFLAWLDGKEWKRPGNITSGIEPMGVRRKGKPQLSQDEASKLLAWCVAHPKDLGAIATATAFLLNLRATEIATRLVHHLDGRGTLMHITDAKTRAGNRPLKIPTLLQPLLASLAKGLGPDMSLFRDHNRWWVLRNVKRCCKAAGVRVVTPHGLRGTHATMATEAGMSGVALARSMGHENETTTREHYSGRTAVANAAIDRVIDALN